MKHIKKINEFLDNNELDKLREYVAKEEHKTYIKEARSKLDSYLCSYKDSFYGLIGNYLIISNSISVYRLNSKGILTKYKLDAKQHFTPLEIMDNIKALNKSLDEMLNEDLVLTDGKFKDEGSLYKYKLVSLCANYDWLGKPTNNVQTFRKDNIEFAKTFLGEDVTYKLRKEDSNGTFSKPITLVESEKGKGLVMGLLKHR